MRLHLNACDIFRNGCVFVIECEVRSSSQEFCCNNPIIWVNMSVTSALHLFFCWFDFNLSFILNPLIAFTSSNSNHIMNTKKKKYYAFQRSGILCYSLSKLHTLWDAFYSYNGLDCFIIGFKVQSENFHWKYAKKKIWLSRAGKIWISDIIKK